ncbi:MAG: HAD family phosphatase [Gordonia sp. (in: high G+C Gram-positive bacteria)]|uniref:HAD family hydrolase n=1 Tax=Gordonia sp. (in: high G+C Gram-positive bacteria) TaxID=84139 RepID=UPI0039E5419F
MPDSARAAGPAAVFFDMDGTLVDTERHWHTAANEVAAALGRPLTDDDEPHVTGRPTRYMAEYLAGPQPERGAVQSISDRLIARFTELVRADSTALPGVPELLRSLAEHRVPAMIVSASPRSVIEIVRDGLGAAYFVDVIGEEDTAESKPAPDPYLAAAALLGVDPARCVAVEDSRVGTASALAAGCRTVVVTADPTVVEGPGLLVRTSMSDVDLPLLTAHAAAGRR